MKTSLHSVGGLACVAAIVIAGALITDVPGANASGTAAPTPQPHVLYLPFVAASPTSAQPAYPPAGSPGMKYVNFYRAVAGLPGLIENAAWSYGDAAHARYSTRNDALTHYEDPGNPWYTPEGAAAAQNSNQIGSYDFAATDEWAVSVWMRAPFHAVGILDPALAQTGFGAFRGADGGLQMAAGIDVLRGLGSIPPAVTLPVRWPGDGMTVPIADHWTETPSPLTSCPGYSAPSGLPVMLIFGGGRTAPVVGGHSFRDGGANLEHCVFSGATYANPDSSLQALGRAILQARNAVVLVPRAPLNPAGRYTASMTVDGVPHTWSFRVSGQVSATADGASFDHASLTMPPPPPAAPR